MNLAKRRAAVAAKRIDRALALVKLLLVLTGPGLIYHGIFFLVAFGRDQRELLEHRYAAAGTTRIVSEVEDMQDKGRLAYHLGIYLTLSWVLLLGFVIPLFF